MGFWKAPLENLGLHTTPESRESRLDLLRAAIAVDAVSAQKTGTTPSRARVIISLPFFVPNQATELNLMFTFPSPLLRQRRASWEEFNFRSPPWQGGGQGVVVSPATRTPWSPP
jgi:hypothetical protein